MFLSYLVVGDAAPPNGRFKALDPKSLSVMVQHGFMHDNSALLEHVSVLLFVVLGELMEHETRCH